MKLSYEISAKKRELLNAPTLDVIASLIFDFVLALYAVASSCSPFNDFVSIAIIDQSLIVLSQRMTPDAIDRVRGTRYQYPKVACIVPGLTSMEIRYELVMPCDVKLCDVRSARPDTGRIATKYNVSTPLDRLKISLRSYIFYPR